MIPFENIKERSAVRAVLLSLLLLFAAAVVFRLRWPHRSRRPASRA